MPWKTYLVLYFKAGKEKPSAVVKKVETAGFTCTVGPVDFFYNWDNEPSKEQILELADKLTEALKDTGAIFNIDTHKTSD